MWQNKKLRVWCFSSSVWAISWALVLIFVSPFGSYVDQAELTSAWFIGVGPPAIGGIATYLYSRYIA